MHGMMIDNDSNDGKTPRPVLDAAEGAAASGPGLERLSELFEKSPVALTLADAAQPDAPLVVVNNAFLDLTGYARDEVIGRNCRFLQADLPNDAPRAEARAVLLNGGQGQIVFHNRRKDGEPFENLLFLQGLVSRRGGTRYFLGSQFLLDPAVTERRIDAHLAEIDTALARAVAAQADLRAEQRRMFANAAHAVANAWLALRS
jgi:PAS domain S-box-containing protein